MEEQAREEAPVYKACIGMRIKFPDGIYRDIAPGTPIPRATTDHWNNPGLWVKRGHVARIDGMPEAPGAYGPYDPPRAVTDADLRAWLERGAITNRSSPFPKANGLQPGTVSAAHDPAEQELDQVPPPAAPVNPALIAELHAKSRKELLKLAEALEVDVKSTGDKDGVVNAIAAAAARRRAAEAEAAAR